MLDVAIAVVTATLLVGIVFVYWINKTRQFQILYQFAKGLDIPGATKHSKQYFAKILAECWQESPNFELEYLIKTIPKCLGHKLPGTIWKGLARLAKS